MTNDQRPRIPTNRAQCQNKLPGDPISVGWIELRDRARRTSGLLAAADKELHAAAEYLAGAHAAYTAAKTANDLAQGEALTALAALDD